MNVLLSVKPKYANEIISGRKKYEFRKSIFKRENIEKMYIYSSSPVKKIIAIVDIDGILSDSPQKLWEQYHEDAGISEIEFFDYFKNSDIGYAIKISNVQEFPTPIDPYIDEDFRPPQSFYYLPMNFLQTYSNYTNNEINYGHGIFTESFSEYSCTK
ncbi:MAG: ASCH domain-containing protein [Methanococcoides sp.]|nr:ASCH domain-containing protein [Methanococcoides sp.]